ncbi:hypothetical protein DFJ74DRAFT_678812 [Hyaloraphidium curvatum]|nr:hypothetical protein DFJ74DRAFT_678812 [Hyaloraphidium curvatum]
MALSFARGDQFVVVNPASLKPFQLVYVWNEGLMAGDWARAYIPAILFPAALAPSHVLCDALRDNNTVRVGDALYVFWFASCPATDPGSFLVHNADRDPRIWIALLDARHPALPPQHEDLTPLNPDATFLRRQQVLAFAALDYEVAEFQSRFRDEIVPVIVDQSLLERVHSTSYIEYSDDVSYALYSNLRAAIDWLKRAFEEFVPAAVAPAPVAPVPIAPAPVVPAPVAPVPIAPTPVAPAPIAPTPVAPAPVASAPDLDELAVTLQDGVTMLWPDLPESFNDFDWHVLDPMSPGRFVGFEADLDEFLRAQTPAHVAMFADSDFSPDLTVHQWAISALAFASRTITRDQLNSATYALVQRFHHGPPMNIDSVIGDLFARPARFGLALVTDDRIAFANLICPGNRHVANLVFERARALLAFRDLDAVFESRVSRIPNAGLGVFAKRDIPAGLPIFAYCGTLTTCLDYEWKVYSLGRDTERYSARSNVFVIDPTDSLGNMPDFAKTFAHLINHSYELANCTLCWKSLDDEESPLLLVYSSRSIGAGDELYLDYGYNFEDF